MSNRKNYPYLASFILSQYVADIRVSSKLDDVVHNFASTAYPSNILGTRADAQRFLREHGNNLDAAFDDIFNPMVDPKEDGETTAEWLQNLDDRLEKYLPHH